MSDLVEVRMEPDSFIKREVTNDTGWRTMGLRMTQRSIGNAPVSSQPAGASGTEGPELVGGGLRDSLFGRYTFGDDATIMIGSSHGVGEDNLNLLALVEQGTEPHIIAPVNSPVLVFTSRKWGLVITPNPVHHPGTKPNRFIERSMQQILHESAGLTLVSVG